VGISIQNTNAGIGIPAFVISVLSQKMPDCAALFRYWTLVLISLYYFSPVPDCPNPAYKKMDIKISAEKRYIESLVVEFTEVCSDH
jgi:hypothetical protein